MMADIVSAVQAAAQLANPAYPPILVGPEFAGMNGAPPRVVWVPSKDKFGPPQKVPNITPAAIRTRHSGAVIEVWGMPAASPGSGEDYRSTEDLVHQTVAAMYSALVGGGTVAQMPGNLEIEDGVWLNSEQKEGGASTQFGRGYQFYAKFKIPVTLPAQTTAGPPLTLPQTNLMEPGDEPA